MGLFRVSDVYRLKPAPCPIDADDEYTTISGDVDVVVGRVSTASAAQVPDELDLQLDDFVDFLSTPDADGFARGFSHRTGLAGSFPISHVEVIRGRLPSPVTVEASKPRRSKFDWWKDDEPTNGDAEENIGYENPKLLYGYIELVSERPATTFDPEAPYAVALFDYESAEDCDLRFSAGDRISLLKRVDAEWYHGESLDGRFGIFPASYVEVVVQLGRSRESTSGSHAPPVVVVANPAFRESAVYVDLQRGAHVQSDATAASTGAALADVDRVSYVQPSSALVPGPAFGDSDADADYTNMELTSYLDPARTYDPALTYDPANTHGHSPSTPGTIGYASPLDAVEMPGKVLRDYCPNDLTDLTDAGGGGGCRLAVTAGETVFVLRSCHDGWFVVRRHSRQPWPAKDRLDEGLVAVDNVDMNIGDNAGYVCINTPMVITIVI